MITNQIQFWSGCLLLLILAAVALCYHAGSFGWRRALRTVCDVAVGFMIVTTIAVAIWLIFLGTS